jgi:hypothetical protein
MADFMSGIKPITPTYPVRPVRPADKDGHPGKQEKKQPDKNAPELPRDRPRQDPGSDDQPTIDEHA